MPLEFEALRTCQEAAEEIGVTDAYIRQLIAARKLRAKRVGARLWLISDEEIQRFKSQARRQGGRPRISD